MKGIIIYAGKYGATAQYAQWLADTLKLPALPAEKTNNADIAGRDLIILGSSVYVGNLVIRRWLKQNEGALAGKPLLLFIVCGTSGDDKKAQDKIIRHNLSPAVRRAVKVFFLPGRCMISKLSWKDRLMLYIGAMLAKEPAQKAGMRSGFDRMDRKALDELIREVKSILMIY